MQMASGTPSTPITSESPSPHLRILVILVVLATGLLLLQWLMCLWLSACRDRMPGGGSTAACLMRAWCHPARGACSAVCPVPSSAMLCTNQCSAAFPQRHASEATPDVFCSMQAPALDPLPPLLHALLPGHFVRTLAAAAGHLPWQMVSSATLLHHSLTARTSAGMKQSEGLRLACPEACPTLPVCLPLCSSG